MEENTITDEQLEQSEETVVTVPAVEEVIPQEDEELEVTE